MISPDEQNTPLFRQEALRYRSREAPGQPLVTTAASHNFFVVVTFVILATSVAIGLAVRVWSR